MITTTSNICNNVTSSVLWHC